MTELSQTLTTDYRTSQGDYQRIQYIPVSQSTSGLQQPQHIQLQVVQVAPVYMFLFTFTNVIWPLANMAGLGLRGVVNKSTQFSDLELDSTSLALHVRSESKAFFVKLSCPPGCTGLWN